MARPSSFLRGTPAKRCRILAGVPRRKDDRVSDPEYAVQESKLIYSRNCLNVSITRAKSKCVVILSKQLLEAPPSAWDNPQVAEGSGFMRGVVQLAKQNGEEVQMPWGEVELTLYRLAKLV